MRSSPERIADRSRTSVPVPKFAVICGTLSCELRNQRDTSKSNVLVPPGTRSSQSDSRHGGANFGTAAFLAATVAQKCKKSPFHADFLHLCPSPARASRLERARDIL